MSLLSEEQWLDVEAATYGFLETFIFEALLGYFDDSQSAVRKAIDRVSKLVHVVDAPFGEYLERENAVPMTAFRWVVVLFFRDMPMELCLQLWDSYVAEESAEPKIGLQRFHVCVLTAFYMWWKPVIQGMEFQDLIMTLQNIPTGRWTSREIKMLVAQAFIYKDLFDREKRLYPNF